MKKKLFGFLSFAVTVAVLVGMLKVLTWLNADSDQSTIRKYPSIEAVGAKLGIRDIYVPSYFPATLGWPPAEILAQSKPFEAVVMEFKRPEDGETALIISQSARPEFAPDMKIRFTEVTEKIPYALKGREALLEAGTCNDRSPCSRISWDEDGTRIRLAMQSPPLELIRIAESMLR